MEHTGLKRTNIKEGEKRSEKKKTIILTVVLSLFLIGGVGTWGFYTFYGHRSLAGMDIPSKEDIKTVVKESGTDIYKPTIEVPESTINERINEMHDYWNQELGYGEWGHYNFKANREELKSKASEIETDILPYVSGPLQTDIEKAITYTRNGFEKKDIDSLKMAHRIFHDLDITLNDYKAGDFWNATKTAKWIKEKSS
ncbi:hypothetical protein [Fictibacillus barbaricus]|uniref:Uncharacterized protein n=1 Tax=Fictibacillus barbaricus TaxID=182136 RepID=A0ABU1U0W9_9BACL|nr:hypothetical protein [Fictibacillus barbaricus]MDR7073120.1 hypothetical protein [Fictibacillus barbaricus]